MRQWYANLAEREQRFVLIGGIGTAVILLLGLVFWLNRNINQARMRVERKQDDLAFIQAAVPQLSGAGLGGGSAIPGESLLSFVDSSARESGLGNSLASSEPSADRKTLHVNLNRVPFDGLIAWLARLAQNHGVSVDSAEIESAGEPGLVNAGLVLRGS